MIKIGGKDVPVIDAHVHIWEKFDGYRFGDIKTEPLGYGMVRQGGEEYLMLPPELKDHVLPIGVLEVNMKMAGVDKAVLIQNRCYGDQRDYIRGIIEKNPGKYASLGCIDPRDHEEVVKQMDILFYDYHFLGFKMEIPDTPFVLDAPEYDFLWKKISDMGAMIALDLGWGDVPCAYSIEELTNVVKRYPDMKMVLCHLGVSRLWDEKQLYPFPWLQKTLHLLDINKDNLFFDFSGMQTCDPSGEYPFYRCHQFLRVVKDMGAIDKVMWGSDAPMIQRTCTYKQTLTYVTKYCPFLTDEEMEGLLYKTAEKVYFR